jgi:hypothetical protein
LTTRIISVENATNETAETENTNQTLVPKPSGGPGSVTTLVPKSGQQAMSVPQQTRKPPLRFDRGTERDRRGGLIERRRARRFEVEWGAEINGKDVDGVSFSDSAKLDNLSSHGAFLYMTRQLKTGTRVDVSIQLPFDSERWMKYSAEVVRLEQDGEQVGVAVKFSNIRPRFMF